jgi:putative ABC transport system substrate-binding protein
MILADLFLGTQTTRIASFMNEHRIPTAFAYAFSVTQSVGLIGYGTDFYESGRQAAGYVDKILKGAKPGDLPVQQPTKLQLAVSLKVAKQLDVTIPPSVLVRADQVIE